MRVDYRSCSGCCGVPSSRVSPRRATYFWRNPQSGFSLLAKGALHARGSLTSRSEVRRTPHLRKRKATRWSGSFWGQSPNSPSLRLALRVRCHAPQRNGCLTPITQHAVLGKSGVRHKLGYRLKQVPALIRFCLRSSAQPDGLGD